MATDSKFGKCGQLVDTQDIEFGMVEMRGVGVRCVLRGASYTSGDEQWFAVMQSTTDAQAVDGGFEFVGAGQTLEVSAVFDSLAQAEQFAARALFRHGKRMARAVRPSR